MSTIAAPAVSTAPCFQKLADGEWIDAHDNLALVGPSGVGKSSDGRLRRDRQSGHKTVNAVAELEFRTGRFAMGICCLGFEF
jgi:hypothetical protein